MTDALGFWSIAEADPGRVAVVDAQGRRTTFGELCKRRLRDPCWEGRTRRIRGARAGPIRGGGRLGASTPGGSS